MGGKKKKGKKKGKKGKKDVIEDPDDEYKVMDLETLKKTMANFKAELQEVREKRNYIQLERDTLNEFYLNTKNEVRKTEAEIIQKEHKVEELEESHRVALKVYVQKVKHLEYEQKQNNDQIERNAKDSMETEVRSHEDRQSGLRKDKHTLKEQLDTDEKHNISEINKTNQQNERLLDNLRESFEANHKKLQEKYEKKLEDLREDLELRQKVEIHEIEERKNQHINDLLKSHEEAFRNLKSYYQDITHENLALIKDQKETEANLAARKAEIIANIANIEQQNKLLKDPLDKAQEERRELQNEVAGFQKCQMSLKNARARLVGLREKFEVTKKQKEELERKYQQTEQEKEELIEKFEFVIVKIKERAEYKNIVLDTRLQELQDHFERKEAQLSEVLHKAEIDPRYIQEITKQIQESIETKNTILKNLKYSLAHATKAYNDAIRVYEAKLVEFGIPAEELGFQPLDTKTSTMPAGLVAA
eukprot:CAMPEP_0115020674 /NCGR_PEP_ID=MMETSP0216-20121206/30327_1 /TAXON_ID=223996 /ORGANISM="Protocruzia adherens, Strain Boccale" /LENGTH=475 /DNA_ID=CAMNT_0002392675 /DNA_START=48 /DNA_END=1475 /DNA_ORIENTATION=+